MNKLGAPIIYRSGYRAQLAESATAVSEIYPDENIHTPFYSIYTNGIIVAVAGYAWDFATWFPDFDSIKRGSLFHDVICQAVREGRLDKKWLPKANKMLKRHCIEDGMHGWLAKKVLKYTNKYAGRAGKNKHRKRVSPKGRIKK